jgi:uncharacterized protein YhaN
MKILRVRIHRFGPLRDVDTGADPLPGLTVVLGPNEAGKSSFHLALRTLLYGIYPTRPEAHPYAPWDGSELGLEGEVEGHEGEVTTVHRRLLSTPWGRLRSASGEETDLRNDTLPWAAHVPREIYEELFSITLPELARLQEANGRPTRGWSEVRDRLLAGMGTGELAAPRQVAEGLEEEARRLWRPDRRGRPRALEVEESIASLSGRRAAAVERDTLLRGHQERLGRVQSLLEEHREALVEAEATLARIRTLTPLAGRLRRMDQAWERAGDPAFLDRLPPDPPARLRELEEDVRAAEARVEEVAAELDARERAVPEEDAVDQRLLARRDRAWALTLETEVVRDWEGRWTAASTRLEGVEEEVARLGEELFGTPSAPVPARAVLSLSTSELTDRIRERDEAERRRGEAEERLLAARAVPLPPEPPSSTPLSVQGLLVAGLFLLLVGGGLLASARVGAGMALLAAGLVVAGQGWLLRSRWAQDRDRTREARKAQEEERHALGAREAELAARVTSLDEEIRGLLGDLPLRPERSERPREGLVGELSRLQELFRRRETVRGEIQELDRGLRETADRLSRLLREVEGLTLPDELLRALPLLAERIQEADERARARHQAVREVERDRGELARLRREAEAHGRALEAFRSRLSSLGLGETGDDEAAREATRRLTARQDALRLLRELEEEAGDVEELRLRVAQLDGEMAALAGGEEADPQRIRLVLEARVEDLRRELEERREEAGHLQAEIRSLAAEETVDVVEGALVELAEERAALRKERDRLWLLARAVRVAEQRYRDAHQPDLTRRAGHYLERFTGGRYSRILLGDEGDADTLLLQAPHLPGRRPVTEPLSTGTRDQVFLALRLAVVDQMDREGARLPLLLDEVLVNWDAERRSQALELLGDVAEERQVLLFTCHPAMAEEAEERGARRVELPGPA